MSLAINTNLSSLMAQKNVGTAQSEMATAMQRLSTGLRINSAADDAAGLAIGTRMDSQVRGLNVAIRNTNDAVSMIQTADGTLSTVTGAFQRMRELAVQAANGSNGSGDLTNLDKEYQQLSTEVNRVAGATKFNGIALTSTQAGAFSFQVGANSSDTMSVTTKDATQYLTTPGDLTSSANATTALSAIDTALDSVNSDRATYGAALNRFGFTIQNLNNSVTNQTAAKSRVMDADFGQETANLAKANVLQQAGIAMLTQANQAPNAILGLLR
jgi:flagellin